MIMIFQDEQAGVRMCGCKHIHFCMMLREDGKASNVSQKSKQTPKYSHTHKHTHMQSAVFAIKEILFRLFD